MSIHLPRSRTTTTRRLLRRIVVAASLAAVTAGAVLADSQPPVGTSIDVHKGGRTTTTTEITVSLAATDDVGVTGYYIGQDPSIPVPGLFLPVTPAAAYADDVPYTISGSFGDVTLFARFIDAADNISAPLVYEIEYVDKLALVDWTTLDGSTIYDTGISVVTDALGNSYVSGYWAGNLFGGGETGFVAKYDTSGVRQWRGSLGGGIGTGQTQAVDLALDPFGNVYATGYDLVDVQGQTSFHDFFLVKYDAGGTFQWYEPLTTEGSRNWGLGVTTDGSGTIYAVGQTNGTLPGETNAGGNDAFLLEYDGTGSLQWGVQFGTTMTDTAEDVIFADGSLYVVGSTGGPLFGETNLGSGSDIFLSKFDTSGAHQWTRLMGTERTPEQGHGVAVRGNHVYVTGGAKDTCSCATMDVFLASYTTDGVEEWTRIYDGHTFQSSEEAFSVAVDSRGDIYVAGLTWDDLDGNLNEGSMDLMVMKFDPFGDRLTTLTYGTANGDRAFGVAADPSNRTLVAGYAAGDLLGESNLGYDDIALVRLDLAGLRGPRVHLDGFESGDFSAWSSASP